MKQQIARIVEGIALRLEESPGVGLFVKNMKKVEDILLVYLINTLIYRLGVNLSDITLDGEMITFLLDGKSYKIPVKTLPLKSGKGYIVRSVHGALKKYGSSVSALVMLVYPFSDEFKEADDLIVESLREKGSVIKRPIFIGDRQLMIYALVVGKEKGVTEVQEQVIYSEETEEEVEEKSSGDVSVKTDVPGLLYFRREGVSPEEIMDALAGEGKILSDLMRKRAEAVKVLGERGLSVVSNSDIATHRLYIADLSGGFNDFVSEVVRLKGEGIWDDSVKDVVRAFLKEYERLGVDSDTIKASLSKHHIDISV